MMSQTFDFNSWRAAGFCKISSAILDNDHQYVVYEINNNQ